MSMVETIVTPGSFKSMLYAHARQCECRRGCNGVVVDPSDVRSTVTDIVVPYGIPSTPNDMTAAMNNASHLN